MIINSLLDNDLYKFTMMQAVFHNYPKTIVKYKFKCRTPDFKFKQYQIDNIIDEIKYLGGLIFTKPELEFLSSLRYIKPDFVNFLRTFQLEHKYVIINNNSECGLNIEITGPWISTILFEVPILAIVSEIISKDINPYPHLSVISVIDERLCNKIKIINKYPKLKFTDFGTRRRYSFSVYKYTMENLKHHPQFTGTSNLYFALTEGIPLFGTMAHEWLQAHQAFTNILNSQKQALEVWVKEYRGDLGIALTDVIGVDAFLKDFDLYFCKLFDGVRHDSGCPYSFTEKIIKHYEQNNIDPKIKTIVFSDGLTFDLMVDLYKEFSDRINVSFGIGTNLTNDVGNNKPISIVIKMIECNNQPVAKISDSQGKGMCEDEIYVKYLKSIFGISN